MSGAGLRETQGVTCASNCSDGVFRQKWRGRREGDSIFGGNGEIAWVYAGRSVAAGEENSCGTEREACLMSGAELCIPAESKEAALIDRLALRQCLGALSAEDRNLIIMRFFRGKTQAETAKLLGFTQVGVSRRERKILAELREKLV